MNEKIIFQSGVLSGEEFPLTQEELTFGRDPENSVVLDDVQISRHHLRIYLEKGQWMVEDLQSTNGSQLNGKALKKAQKLKNGDVVLMGESAAFKVSLAVEQPQEQVKKTEAPKRFSLKKEKQPDPMLENPLEEAQEEEEPVADEEKGPKAKLTDRLPKWAIILLVAIAFIIIFCVIPLVIIEVTDQWCNLFSGFFNAVQPGVCP